MQYLNNVLETGSSVDQAPGARKPTFPIVLGSLAHDIDGYEAIHMIRKGQACGTAACEKIGLLDQFILGLFAAAN